MRHSVVGISVAVCLMACGQSAEDIAAAKLDAVTDAPSVPMVIPLPTEPTPRISYEGIKDPFINPYRKAHQASDANADAKPKTTDIEKSKDVKPSDPPSSKSEQSAASKVRERHEPSAIDSQASQASQSPWYRHAKVVQIDSNRPRQPLESFELSQLIYQGRISDGVRTMAIIQSPDGRVHQVGIGQYLGRHHGRVMHIDARTISLDEAVLADDGRYYHRSARLGFIRQ